MSVCRISPSLYHTHTHSTSCVMLATLIEMPNSCLFRRIVLSRKEKGAKNFVHFCETKINGEKSALFSAALFFQTKNKSYTHTHSLTNAYTHTFLFKFDKNANFFSAFFVSVCVTRRIQTYVEQRFEFEIYLIHIRIYTTNNAM